MSERPSPGAASPGDPAVAGVPDATTQPVAAAGEDEAYDPTGLDLARSLTAGLTGGPARRLRTGTGSGPDGSSAGRRRTGPQVSGSHPDERDPQTLGRTVDKLLAARGWSTELNVHTLLGRWPALVGPQLAEHTVPQAYADKVITVRASSTAWATQLRGLAPSIVATLNEQLGQGTVERITVLGPDVPSWKRGRRTVRNGRGPRDTYG